jgi:DNA-binding transcriptional LysR family regulator
VLELGLIKRSPQRRIVATDYGEDTLAQLREILPELDVVKHDLRADGPVEADMHLFHRIDTELPNSGWREVLQRFAAARVLVVATEVHDLNGLIREVRKGLQGGSRAGWARNRAAFEALWKNTHDARALRMNDLDAWLLEPRSGGRA